MMTLHDVLKNSIMDKPVYVTVDAIEYMGNLGKWGIVPANNDWWVHELVPKWTTP